MHTSHARQDTLPGRSSGLPPHYHPSVVTPNRALSRSMRNRSKILVTTAMKAVLSFELESALARIAGAGAHSQRKYFTNLSTIGKAKHMKSH